jgi:parallel beta-helix repeat protein
LLALMLFTGGCRFGAVALPVGTPSAQSTLIGCNQATARVTISADAHLDPACVYERGFDIVASNVTLDCRGAKVTRAASATDSYGILVTTPATASLSDVTVRNCAVSGFSNNLRVTRTGFKTLAAGSEYLTPTSNIVVDNSSFIRSRASGVFVDGYVTGVTLSHVTVSGSGSVGIYLEAGSKDNVIADSIIARNGFPSGVQTFDLNGTPIQYISTGREGIAVDGSRDNWIHDNLIVDNSAGGIVLYKNCGEDVSAAGHWVRRYGATGNRIDNNKFVLSGNGVWVGSRAAENQYFMDCSDTPIIDAPFNRVYLDPADRNTISGNLFHRTTNAIRVEADDTTVTNNVISQATRGVVIGTKHRYNELAQPITGAIVTGNRTVTVSQPYGTIWGAVVASFAANTADGASASLAAGTQPTINPFLFVLQILP